MQGRGNTLLRFPAVGTIVGTAPDADPGIHQDVHTEAMLPMGCSQSLTMVKALVQAPSCGMGDPSNHDFEDFEDF